MTKSITSLEEKDQSISLTNQSSSIGPNTNSGSVDNHSENGCSFMNEITLKIAKEWYKGESNA